jgi:hypothetical protein
VPKLSGACYRGILYWNCSINISIFDLHLAYMQKYIIPVKQERYYIGSKNCVSGSMPKGFGKNWPMPS